MSAIIQLDFTYGSNLELSLKKSIRLANTLKVVCKIEFNGIVCFISLGADFETELKKYELKTKIERT
jgi:hypothetical protein